MRERTLRAILGGCVAFALTPVLPWLAARLFTAVDDRWLAALGNLAWTIPTALGVAAITFAVHGLLLHAEAVATLEDEVGEALEELATVGASAPLLAGSGGGPAADTPTEPLTEAGRGSKMAVRERTSAKMPAGKKAGKLGKRATREAGWAARTAVRRGARKQLRNLKPF